MATPAASKSEKHADEALPETVKSAETIEAEAADPLGRHPWLIERDKAEAAGK